jgi:hypothetical protein
MPDHCPLEGINLNQVKDDEGWVWEPMIPSSCHLCLSHVLDAAKVSVHHDVINEETGEPYDENEDRYRVRGISLTNETGGRLAIEETGVDLIAGYDGPKESETIFGFICSKELLNLI